MAQTGQLAVVQQSVVLAQSCGSCGASAKDNEGGRSHQRRRVCLKVSLLENCAPSGILHVLLGRNKLADLEVRVFWEVFGQENVLPISTLQEDEGKIVLVTIDTDKSAVSWCKYGCYSKAGQQNKGLHQRQLVSPRCTRANVDLVIRNFNIQISFNNFK